MERARYLHTPTDHVFPPGAVRARGSPLLLARGYRRGRPRGPRRTWPDHPLAGVLAKYGSAAAAPRPSPSAAATPTAAACLPRTDRRTRRARTLTRAPAERDARRAQAADRTDGLVPQPPMRQPTRFKPHIEHPDGTRRPDDLRPRAAECVDHFVLYARHDGRARGLQPALHSGSKAARTDDDDIEGGRDLGAGTPGGRRSVGGSSRLLRQDLHAENQPVLTRRQVCYCANPATCHSGARADGPAQACGRAGRTRPGTPNVCILCAWQG